MRSLSLSNPLCFRAKMGKHDPQQPQHHLPAPKMLWTLGDPWGPLGTLGDPWGPLGTLGNPWWLGPSPRKYPQLRSFSRITPALCRKNTWQVPEFGWLIPLTGIVTILRFKVTIGILTSYQVCDGHLSSPSGAGCFNPNDKPNPMTDIGARYLAFYRCFCRGKSPCSGLKTEQCWIETLFFVANHTACSGPNNENQTMSRGIITVAIWQCKLRHWVRSFSQYLGEFCFANFHQASWGGNAAMAFLRRQGELFGEFWGALLVPCWCPAGLVQAMPKMEIQHPMDPM